jgi:hypothetical protein
VEETSVAATAPTSVGSCASGRFPAGPIATPARVGRYRIDGVLGAGGMAVVYLAHDPLLDRAIALKVIRAGGDAGAASRLLGEGQALARVSHPNVIHVYEVGREADRVVYIAMERIVGITLEAWLRTARAAGDVRWVFADAGRGLAAAHAAGLVHRDFKPDNAMVGADGRVRVLDFGLARAAGAAGGAVSGTPAYMSPEQWRGEAPDARSDQFSFCVAVARALAGGAHPFGDGSRAAVRDAVLAGRPRPAWARAIPRRLRRVLRRGMALDPAARHASIDAVVAALDPAPRRRVWIAAAIAAVGCAGAGAAVVAADALAAPGASTDRTTIYGAPQRVTARSDLARAAVSPDGMQVALLTQDALVVQPVRSDAVPRELVRGRFQHHALAWSPDGRRIGVSIVDAGGFPGLELIDVGSGRRDRIGLEVGLFALLPGDELVDAHYESNELVVYALGGGRAAPVRRCRLPEPSTGIRAVRYEPVSGSLLVQVDRGDRASVIARVGRTCAIEILAGPVAALGFVLRQPGDHVVARLMGAHDLVELGPDDTDGAPSGVHHVVQSNDYEPLALRRDGRLVHLERTTRWRLIARDAAGAITELDGGPDDGRISISADGASVAQVDGVYRRGVLRVGGFGARAAIAHGVTRARWSPDGRRLVVVRQLDGGGYALATWDRTTGAFTPERPLDTAYDVDPRWIDDHRVAFGTPHGWRGFTWIDVDTGATGELAVGGGARTWALARAHRGDRLAYATTVPGFSLVWTFDPAAAVPAPALLAALPIASRLKLTWTPDDAAIVVVDGQLGALWSIATADGAVTALPPIPLARGDGVATIDDVTALPDRLVLTSGVRAAGVYVSRPLDR